LLLEKLKLWGINSPLRHLSREKKRLGHGAECVTRFVRKKSLIEAISDMLAFLRGRESTLCFG